MFVYLFSLVMERGGEVEVGGGGGGAWWGGGERKGGGGIGKER